MRVLARLRVQSRLFLAPDVFQNGTFRNLSIHPDFVVAQMPTTVRIARAGIGTRVSHDKVRATTTTLHKYGILILFPGGQIGSIAAHSISADLSI